MSDRHYFVRGLVCTNQASQVCREPASRAPDSSLISFGSFRHWHAQNCHLVRITGEYERIEKQSDRSERTQ